MDACKPCDTDEGMKEQMGEESGVLIDCGQISRDVYQIYLGVSLDDSAYTRQDVAKRIHDLYEWLQPLISRMDDGVPATAVTKRLRSGCRQLETSVAQLGACMLAREMPRDSEEIRLLLVLQAYVDGICRALMQKASGEDTSQATMVLDSWLTSMHWDAGAAASSSSSSSSSSSPPDSAGQAGHWAQKCTQCTSVSACRHRPAPASAPVHATVDNADVMRCALAATRMLLRATSIQTSELQSGLDRICLAHITALRSELLGGVLRAAEWAGSHRRQPHNIRANGHELAERLEAIANAAEGDMGRTAFRDLMLSFQLPRSVVGCRRGLLLQAAAHNNARLTYGTTVHRAHTRAMLGSLAVWKEPPEGNPLSDIEKSCALLSGLAMLLSTGQSEHIRAGVAFEGLVMLPFLMHVERTLDEEQANDDEGGAGAPVALPQHTLKHRIYMHRGWWTFCYIKGNGTLRKIVEGRGLKGLEQCVVALLAIHDTAK